MAHDLPLHEGLGGLRVRSQLVQLFLGHIVVHDQLELLLDPVLHRVLKLSLDRLAHAQDVTEFLSERPMHGFFHAGLGLILVLLIIRIDVVFHQV